MAQEPPKTGSVAAPTTQPAGVAPAAGALGGVQGANIFEVKPDASADPDYARQTNAERARVQPGNNAPMWRQVAAGVTGTSSLPKSEAPEAGNLIQPFVQYPGSRRTNAGQAWREVRNNWLIPYGGELVLIVAGAIVNCHTSLGRHVLINTGARLDHDNIFGDFDIGPPKRCRDT